MGSAAAGLAVSLSHIEGLSGPKQADLLALAREVDAAGAAQIVLSEHVVLSANITGHPPIRPGDPPAGSFFPSDEEYPEPLVTLAAIAAVTSRARLSTNILIAPLRPAVLLAKMAATVDVLSGGRLDLGLGAGWHQPEFDAVGVPLQNLAHRIQESVAACRSLWAGGPSSYSGTTVSFSDVYCSPTPIQQRLPVFLGGQPVARTARVIAAVADGWSAIGTTTPEEIRLGCDLLRQAGADVGRAPTEFRVRASLSLARDDSGHPSLAATLAPAAEYVRAGATLIQLPAVKGLVDPSATPVAAVAKMVAEAVDRVATL
jgi:probable F420-dependent oxidoreductase